jgi:hypothetical protein
VVVYRGVVNPLRKPTLFILLLSLALSGLAVAQMAVIGDLARPFDVLPGTIIEDALELRNSGADDSRVRVYLSDYSFNADGTSHYPEPGTLPRSNASWIELGALPTVIPAGGSVSLPYRVKVDQAAPAGSYWSLIMVEELAPQRAATGTVTLQTVLRYGVQVITTIAPAPAELVFANPTFHEQAGESVLTLDVLNTGERSVLARHYLDLFDATGTPIGRVEGSVLRTYPGTSIRQNFVLGALAPDSYLAVVIADGGDEDLFGAQYNLTVK